VASFPFGEAMPSSAAARLYSAWRYTPESAMLADAAVHVVLFVEAYP
jgi:hypothetical protein